MQSTAPERGAPEPCRARGSDRARGAVTRSAWSKGAISNRIQPSVFRWSYIAALSMLLLTTVACSEPHHLSHDELRSMFHASISLASEAEASLLRQSSRDYSDHFLEGHLSYLREQGSELQHEIARVSVSGTDAAALGELKSQTAELLHVLDKAETQELGSDSSKTSLGPLRLIRRRLEASIPQ
jgi:hypothetical protein